MPVKPKKRVEADERIMLGIVRISERFKKEASAKFGEMGLTFAQYNVLRILEIAPGGRMTITEVGNRMLVSGANMTGIAKRLEKSGLITRQASTADERVKFLQISSAGRRILTEVGPEEKMHCSSFLAGFTPGEKETLLQTVVKILKSRSIDNIS